MNIKSFIQKKHYGSNVLTVNEMYNTLDEIAIRSGADPTHALIDFHGCKDSSKEEEADVSRYRYGPSTWFSNNTLAGMSDVDPAGIAAAMHQAESVMYTIGGPHMGIYLDDTGRIHEGLLDRHNLLKPGNACGALHGFLSAALASTTNTNRLFDPQKNREMAIIEDILHPHIAHLRLSEYEGGRAASLSLAVDFVAEYASQVMHDQVLAVREELHDKLALVATMIMYDTGTQEPDLMVPVGPVYVIRNTGPVQAFDI